MAEPPRTRSAVLPPSILSGIPSGSSRTRALGRSRPYTGIHMAQNRKNPGPRGTTDSRREEAARLHEWCRVVLDTMAELHPEMTSRADSMHGLDGALREGRVSAFRVATKDLLEWVHGLKPSDRARIDQVLRSRFGVGLL
jgi:hypothetical protein